MKKYSQFQIVFLLVSFVFSFAFGLDIYIPILPQMTYLFETTPHLVQLTMSLFLFTVGLGQLIAGPLSDHFGRKKVLLISALIFAIGSLGCTYCTGILELILMRVISAIGACGMLVTTFALVRDIFSHDESAKMYSFLNGATGISPTFAPLLGGFLAATWGWKSVFLSLVAIGLYSAFIAFYFIEETLEPTKRVKISRHVFERYVQIYKNRQFLLFSCIGGFSQAIFFGFFSISPFIIIELLKVSTEHFGYYFAFFGLVLSIGGFISGKLIEKIGLFPTMKVGIALMFCGGILTLVWASLTDLSLQSFLIPMMVACMGAVFLVGSAASAALEPFPRIAGTASAAFGCLEFGICSSIGALLMLFPVNSTIPYGICIILMALFSSICFFLSQRQTYAITSNQTLGH